MVRSVSSISHTNSLYDLFSIVGDSDGALFVVDRHDNLRHKAVGIASSEIQGSVLCSVENYQLYIDVALYRNWIEGVVIETC